MVDVRFLPYFAFFLIVDILLGMSQASISYAQQEMPELNNNGQNFYNGAGSIISSYQKDYNISNTSNIPNMPETKQGDTASSTYLFSDTWNAFKNFFTDVQSGISIGVKIFQGMLYGIYNVLSSMGLPEIYVGYIGTLWHLLTLISFMVFFRGY